MKVELHRLYLVNATHGVLLVDGQKVCYTLELPWIGNQRSISCIPEGDYQIVKRESPRFKAHFELLDVPFRSFILIHPANNAKRDLKGCIAPVTQFIAEGWGSQSKLAMDHVKQLLYPQLLQSTVTLRIVRASDPEISTNLQNQIP